MQKLALVLFSIISFTAGHTQTSKPAKSSGSASLNGAWRVVRWNEDGNDTTFAKPVDYWVLSDGFFSDIGLDSTARWIDTHGGTYEVDGNILKEKIVYSSHSDRIGMT